MACSWGSRETTSGGGSFFFDQAKLLQSRGMAVEMLFADYSFGFRNKLIPGESKRMESLLCHFIQAKSVVPFSARINLRFHGLQLMRKVKTLPIVSPDLIICQSMIELSHLADLMKDYWKCQVVFVEHHSAFTSKGRYHLPSILPFRIRRVRNSGIHVFAVSQFLQNELVECRKLPAVRRLFNPVPLELEERKFQTPKSSGFRFLAVGRFDINKRIDGIARAFCEYYERGGNGQLLLITDNGGKQALDVIIRDHPNIPIEINYEYGRLTREQIFSIVEDSHVVVSFSQYETFGMTILESLALGRPVISSDSGGPKDLINASNGFVRDFESTSDLALAMSEMQRNFQSYDLEFIKNETLCNFGIDKWFDIIKSSVG